MFVVWPRRSKGKENPEDTDSVVARPASAVCPLGAQSLCLWFLIFTSDPDGDPVLLTAKGT